MTDDEERIVAATREHQAEIERKRALQKEKNEAIKASIAPFVSDITHYVFHQLQMPGFLSGDIHFSAVVEDGIIIKGNMHSVINRSYAPAKDVESDDDTPV